MLARSLGIACSRRCELLLCFAYLAAREAVPALAHRLVNDANRSAVTLAQHLLELPQDRARELARETLAQAGINAPCRRT